MSWLRRLRNTFRPGRVRREISRELSFHISERADDLRAEGLSDREALRQARVRFGHAHVQAERVRDIEVAGRLDGLLRNLRHTCRALARAPGFTAAVVLTLALGIGANSAVFSALNAVILRPLPFPHADRLVQLRQTHDHTAETNIAPVRLEDWSRLNATFEAITGYFVEDVSETSGELPEMVQRAFVAPRFLDVWGVAPALGRGFTDSEHLAGGPPAVLISERYWRRRLGADPDVLGRTIRIASSSFPVVGVMPADFLFPDRGVDLWLPVGMSSRLAGVRSATWYLGVGRLKAGVSLDQARANLAVVQTQLGDQYPSTDRDVRVEVTPLKDVIVGDARSSFWLLFGAVSVLLLITCTNVAALLLSRATERQRELSVRLSLGATRSALAALVLTEAGVLALAGGILGLLAAAGSSAALRVGAGTIPRIDELAFDWRILLYTLAVTVGVALFCGLIPAIRTGRSGALDASRGAGRVQVSTRNSVQWLLVGAQIALSVTLLTGAGLLVRSFYELSRVDPGFEPARVLTFRMSASWAETADYGRLTQRIDDTLGALHALPGVEAAATSTFLPGVPAQYELTFGLVEARDNAAIRMVAERRAVSPEYFETMRIPVLEGRVCGRPTPGGAADVMVNRAFAARYLTPYATPVGLHLVQDGSPSDVSRIVGVVGDARERGLDLEPAPVAYACLSAPNPRPYFLVRASGDPAAIAQSVRIRLDELEPLRAVYDVATIEDQLGGTFAEDRLRMVLLSLFAATALTLATVGLYGTLSYAVSLRRREIGLRLALGALRRDIVGQFLGRGLRVAGIACVCGVLASIATTRLLATMLYGVSPSDPLTLAAVIAIVLVVAALAAFIPAARAALIEPVRALRQE